MASLNILVLKKGMFILLLLVNLLQDVNECCGLLLKSEKFIHPNTSL